MRSITTFLCSLAFMFVTFSATLAASAVAAGPEWVQLDENADSSFYYDKAGKSRPKEGIVRVETRVVYSEQGKADALKTLSTSKDLAKLHESRYLYELNCGERESRLLNAAHLAKGGKVLRSTDLSSFTEWETIPPEVRMILVLQEACQ